MKRKIALISVIALIFSLGGCVQPPASSGGEDSTPIVSQELPLLQQMSDPSLDQAVQRLAKADFGQVQVDTDRVQSGTTGLTVQVDKGLPLELAITLSQWDVAPVDAIYNVSDYIKELQIQLGGEDYFTLQMFLFNKEDPLYPDQMVIWLQSDEESKSYLGSAAAFGTVYDLLSEHTVIPKVIFESPQPILLEEQLGDDNRAYQRQMVQLGDRMVRLWDEGTISYLDMVDILNGEIIWEESRKETDYTILSLEECFDQDDRNYRVLASDRAFYRDLDDEDDVVVYLLPEGDYLVGYNRVDYAYDLDLRAMRMAYRGESGVYVGELLSTPVREDVWQLSFKEQPKLVLENSSLMEILGKEWDEDDDKDQERFAPYYDAPHFLQSGSSLVAEIQAPGSQSGLVGLTLVPPKGDPITYTDLFDAMSASVVYPYDSVAVAVGLDRATSIDPQTGELTPVEIPYLPGVHAITSDYESFLLDASYRDDQGNMRHVFKIVQEGKAEVMVLRAMGDRVIPFALTDGYAFFRYKDAEKQGMAAVPLP